MRWSPQSVPPSLLGPLEGEVRSSQVAADCKSAIITRCRRTAGHARARAGRAKSCHAEGVVRCREGREGGEAAVGGEIARNLQIMLTGGITADDTEEIPESGRERYWFEEGGFHSCVQVS